MAVAHLRYREAVAYLRHREAVAYLRHREAVAYLRHREAVGRGDPWWWAKVMDCRAAVIARSGCDAALAMTERCTRNDGHSSCAGNHPSGQRILVGALPGRAFS